MAEKIELLKPHTHGGTSYPAGAMLSVPGQAGPHDADWLVRNGIAEWMPKAVEKPKAIPERQEKPQPQPETVEQKQETKP